MSAIHIISFFQRVYYRMVVCKISTWNCEFESRQWRDVLDTRSRWFSPCITLASIYETTVRDITSFDICQYRGTVWKLKQIAIVFVLCLVSNIACVSGLVVLDCNFGFL